jgi:hypothetical protein
MMTTRSKNRITSKKRGGVKSSNGSKSSSRRSKTPHDKATLPPPPHDKATLPPPPPYKATHPLTSEDAIKKYMSTRRSPETPKKYETPEDDVDLGSRYRLLTNGSQSSNSHTKTKSEHSSQSSKRLSLSKTSIHQEKPYLDELIESSGVDRDAFITSLKSLNQQNIGNIHKFFKRNFTVPDRSPEYKHMVDLLEDPRINDLVCEAALMKK